MAAEIVAETPGYLRVSGELNFDTVLGLRHKGEALIAAAPDTVEVDFSGVYASGSAAVSLMMCWLRAACNADKTIRFSGVPVLLERIIRVSGLSGHLFLDSSPHS